jgi:dUTP pyrophosphatase
VVNGPGVVDAGYRGEIAVVLVNHDPDTAIELRRGDRIAQLVITPVAKARWVPVESLPGTQRSNGGFGSTGGK